MALSADRYAEVTAFLERNRDLWRDAEALAPEDCREIIRSSYRFYEAKVAAIQALRDRRALEESRD